MLGGAGLRPQAPVSFPRLTTAGGIILYAVGNPGLPVLTSVQHELRLSGDFTNLTIPSLTTGSVVVQEGTPPSLVSISLPMLVTGSLTVNSSELASVSLPALQRAPSDADFAVYLGPCPLASLDLPQLETGAVGLDTLPNLTSVSLPHQTSGGLYVSTLPALSSIDLPQLATGELVVNGAPVLASIHVPALTSGWFAVLNAPAVTGLDLPLLESAQRFMLENNATLTSISCRPALPRRSPRRRRR